MKQKKIKGRNGIHNKHNEETREWTFAKLPIQMRILLCMHSEIKLKSCEI